MAPLKRRVDNKITAARPRLVFDLAVGLIKKGHQVSLLGTGDSKVKRAKIIPVIPRGFIEMGPFENEFVARTAFLTKQAKMAERIADDYDIVHNRARPEFFNLFAAERFKTPLLTTLDATMNKETDEVLSLFKKNHLICISKSAAKLAKKTKVYKVIYNGVDINLYEYCPKKENYLLWVGRLGRAKDKKGKFMDTKGVRWAIRLARATRERLLLVGNVEDIEFFNKDVKPYLSRKIRWICPISAEQPLAKKQIVKLMQKAKAVLFPINWEEPFGLVMVEAMSCGTPVIGFARGSVPEVIKHGKTGFVVKAKEGLTGLKKALKDIDKIHPEDCRKHIEKNFSLEKMVDNYEKAYKEIIKR